MSGSSRPTKSSWNGSTITCSSCFCTRLRTHAPSASNVHSRPSSFNFRKCSELVYQIHSTISLSHASAPYCSSAANEQLRTEITHRKVAEETLLRTAEDLKRSNLDLEQFG